MVAGVAIAQRHSSSNGGCAAMATTPRPALTEANSGAFRQDAEGSTPVTTRAHARYNKPSDAKPAQS
eukprot:5494022-Lingulodinium_polyedra.AAC.1